MLEVRILIEIKDISYRIISRLGIDEERIRKYKDMFIETYKMKMKKERIKRKKNRTSMNYGTIIKHLCN